MNTLFINKMSNFCNFNYHNTAIKCFSLYKNIGFDKPNLFLYNTRNSLKYIQKVPSSEVLRRVENSTAVDRISRPQYNLPFWALTSGSGVCGIYGKYNTQNNTKWKNS